MPADILQSSCLRSPEAVSVVIRVGFEPVAGKLLVKRWLRMSGFIAFRRPETGAVGCQHFIADHHVAILVQTKLKLGIRNDDTLAQCVFCAFLV